MPFVKPEQMLRAQEAIEDYSEMLISDGTTPPSGLDWFMESCPICGNRECTKDVVKVSGVYVHPEDVQEADRIERPEIPEKK